MSRVLASRYELFDVIGASDRAHVYRAWDHQLQHIVAVKILDQKGVANPSVVSAFEQSASLAASLPDNPAIATIYDVGRDDDVPYVVTQFVSGTNLKDLVAREAPLPVDRAFRLTRQIAQGLDFAHQYGLIHGDLKPQNILVSPLDAIKLTDFGTLRDETSTTVPHTAMAMVQAQYLSPEQIMDHPPEPASDIYSLGIILFEMLTGRLPLMAPDPAAIRKKHILEDAPDAHDVNPIVPPGASGVVMRALQKDPRNRYRSAAAFASALQDYLLLEKGDTPLYFPFQDGLERERRPSTGAINGARSDPPPSQIAQPVMAPQTPVESRAATTEVRKQDKKKGKNKGKSARETERLHAVQRVRPTTPKRRSLTFMSLLYLAVVGLAGVGGWYTYKAIARAINGSSTPARSQKTKIVHPPPHRKPVKVTHPTPLPASAPGCTDGPVRLIDIYAEETHPVVGQPVTFDYTIANAAAQCRNVTLGLTLKSAPNAPALADQGARTVVAAPPGTTVLKRQFTFPASAAGQVYDVTWVVASRSRADVYGTSQVPHLIMVGGR